jgi:hypothetical protein
MNTAQSFIDISLTVAERYWIQAIWSVNRVHFCFARDIVSERELLGARRRKGTLVSWATSLRAQWQVSSRAGYRTMRQHHRFNLRADDSTHRQTKSLSIERQRSFYIVHPDGDAWFHFISTVPPTRMKDKKLEISTYTQHDASSLAGC